MREARQRFIPGWLSREPRVAGREARAKRAHPDGGHLGAVWVTGVCSGPGVALWNRRERLDGSLREPWGVWTFFG
jgi:hypothetical protein